MYIVCHFDIDEPEPPIRGGVKLWSSFDDAYISAKSLAENWMNDREINIEGPFNFFTKDLSSCQKKGYCRIFESRDFFVWIEYARG